MNILTTSESVPSGSILPFTLDPRPRAFSMADQPNGNTSRALVDSGDTYAVCGLHLAANRSTFSTRDRSSWRAGSS